MHDPPLVPIVTTHPVMQEGMEALLAMKYSVAGSADDAQEAVLLIREHEPDLVALDVNIPGGGGSAIVTTVRPDLPEVKYMVLSASASKEEVADMLKTGIDGYIMKTVEKSHFMRSVRMTLKGRKPISPEVASRLIEIDDDLRGLGRADTLTSHERHVMELVSRGYSYKEVAKTLSTRVRNVDSHIADIFDEWQLPGEPPSGVREPRTSLPPLDEGQVEIPLSDTDDKQSVTGPTPTSKTSSAKPSCAVSDIPPRPGRCQAWDAE